MEIIPGVGIGCIKFGMSQSEVINVLGKPDEINEFEYVEGEHDWYFELYYLNKGLAFSFNADDSYKLGQISITAKGHLLFSKDVLGYKIIQLQEFLSNITNELPKYENCTWGKTESYELLNLESYGLLFWFKSGILDELVCSYLFENDNETVIWP